MNTHDLIQPLIDLGKYLEQAEENCSFASQEIIYWRKKFLDSVPSYSDEQKTAYIQNAFLYIPCKTFLELTPEAYIKVLETHYEC